MNLVPPSDVDALPNAEWHGGVVEHEIKARGVSQGVKTNTPWLTPRATNKPSLTLRAIKNSTTRAVLLWFALWTLPLLSLLAGFVPTADDLGAYHLPLRAYYQSALQAGDNWTWCPWIFGGYHLHGEGQIGGDHPLHQVLYRVLPLHWAFGLECWWAYPATFFGMWWWLRQMRFSTGASQTAALALSLCGYMTLRVVHVNAIQVIAHLPWLLGCLTWLEHRARRSTSLRSLLPPIACSALLTGSQLLLGYPQYVVFTLLAEAMWMSTLAIRTTRHAACPLSTKLKTDEEYTSRRKIVWIIVSSWIAAKTLGLLLGASQVLPTLEYLSLSERVNWTSEQMFEGSWPALNLTQLVAPYSFQTRVVGQNTHELTIFMGIVPISLAVLGLVNRPRRSLRAVQGFAFALCVVGLLLALGEASPLAEVMPYIPVWNRFRFPCRATLLLCLGIALLAALGCQRIFELAKQPKTRSNANNSTIRFTWTERRWLHGLILFSILVPIYGAIAWSEYLGGWPFLFLGPITILLSMILLHCSTQQKNIVRYVIPLLIAAELLVYARTFSHYQQWEYAGWYHDCPYCKWTVAGLSELPKEARGLALSTTNGNLGIDTKILNCSRIGLYCFAPFAQVDGYAGVKPQKHLKYDVLHQGALAAAGVTHTFNSSVPNRITVPRSINVDALSRGNLVGSAEVTSVPAEWIEQIDLHRTALVQAEQHLSEPVDTDRMAVILTEDRPGRLAFALETTRDALLVTTESYHPGWHARVDGADVPTLRVNGDFLGVRIPSAAQRVECYFSDNWHTVGRGISLGSLGLLGLVLCWSRWRYKTLGFAR